MDCSGGRPSEARAIDIIIDGEPVSPNRFYTLATNDYIARGGSGFRSLQFNNTQQDTGVPIRDATMDFMKQFPTCRERCEERGLEPSSCPLLVDCRRDVAAYQSRRCRGLMEESDRMYCLQEEASECLSAQFRSRSDFEICVQAQTSLVACESLYSLVEEEACTREARQAVVDSGVCDGRETLSPRERCIEDRGAGFCLALSAESAADRCRSQARRDAEVMCFDLPCLIGSSEGRIARLLPTNKSLWELDQQASLDAADFMDWIQAEHNDEACY